MIKIGDFSKLAHVTVKTLRYYAKVGLLKPAQIDRFTGYRYYTLDQLPRLNRILALKNLGFSLDQIAVVINGNLSVDRLHAMLCHKQEELQKHLIVEQERLAQVEGRIRQIELEGSLPHQEILLKRVLPQPVVSVRKVVQNIESLPVQVNEMRSLLREKLNAIGIRKDCPWMVIQHNPEYKEKDIDLEVAILLESDGVIACQKNQLNGCQMHTLPLVDTMTSTLFTGGLVELPAIYAALYGWIQSSGYRVSGSSREIHLCVEESQPSSQSMLEIQIPVEKVPVHLSIQIGKEQEMEPKFVTKPAFLVTGTLYQGKNQHGEIPEMWSKEFLPRMHEIQGFNPDGGATYGVCYMEEGLPEGEFCYMAAIEVAPGSPVPVGMKQYQVPEQRYAVFEHHGILDNLGKTYEWIYQSWLPQSGYKRVNGPDFEFYNEAFKPDSEDSILYLYVPIE